MIKIKRFAINTGNEAFDELLLSVYQMGENQSILKGMIIGIVSTLTGFVSGTIVILLLSGLFC